MKKYLVSLVLFIIGLTVFEFILYNVLDLSHQTAVIVCVAILAFVAIVTRIKKNNAADRAKVDTSEKTIEE